MPITERQLELRRKTIGASDMAAVLGVDPWRNALDVYYDKTGQLAPLEETQAMRLGTALEDAVLSWAEGQIGPIWRNQRRVHSHLPIAANCDGIARTDGAPVEAKTSGIMGPTPDEWGDEGTDQVPERVIVQAHVQMMCLGNAPFCYVPALLGGRGMLLYAVPFSETIAARIADAATCFWASVQEHVPPDCGPPSMETFKLLKRTPKKSVPIQPHLVTAYQTACENERRAKEEKEAVKQWILTNIGDAEAGFSEEGGFTYYEQTRGGIDIKALKADLPEVAEKYATKTKSRVLRFSKKMKG